MLNLLIFCKKFETIKSIINKIIPNLNNVRIIGIANTLKESENILKETQPDLIITFSKEIISTITQNFINYYPKIILLSKLKYITQDYNNLIIVDSSKKIETITYEICKFIKANQSTQREKAINTLSKLGFDFKLSGTVYLLDSILYAHTYKGSYSFENLERDIYSHVAKINSTTLDRVKWSVNRAIKYMYNKHTSKSYKIIENYFYLKFPSKPTAKLIISLIANNLDKKNSV